MPTLAAAGNNIFTDFCARQHARLIRREQAAGGNDPGAAGAYVSLPSFQYNWARFPAIPPPGEARAMLRMPDETLTHYAEQYLLYIAPWRHLVGTLAPNFYQFIAWHEHAMPPARPQLEKAAA